MILRDIIRKSEENDLRYFGLLQESVNNWEKEHEHINDMLEEYEDNKLKSPLSLREVTTLIDRKNHLAEYLNDSKARMEKIQPRISQFNMLMQIYDDRG